MRPRVLHDKPTSTVYVEDTWHSGLKDANRFIKFTVLPIPKLYMTVFDSFHSLQYSSYEIMGAFRFAFMCQRLTHV